MIYKSRSVERHHKGAFLRCSRPLCSSQYTGDTSQGRR